MHPSGSTMFPVHWKKRDPIKSLDDSELHELGVGLNHRSNEMMT